MIKILHEEEYSTEFIERPRMVNMMFNTKEERKERGRENRRTRRGLEAQGELRREG